MRLSELLHRDVATESGRDLGHVHDVRAERRGSRLVVTGVVVGRRGVLEHFGIGVRRARTGAKLRSDGGVVPWEAVVRVSSGKVVVRDGTVLNGS
jgi:sporulation protein YlmC with PRC-barrel domain